MKYDYDYLKSLSELICERTCPGLRLKFGKSRHFNDWQMRIFWKNIYIDSYTCCCSGDPCACLEGFCGLGQFRHEPWLSYVPVRFKDLALAYGETRSNALIEIAKSVNINLLNQIHDLSKDCTSIDELKLRLAVSYGE